MLYYYKGTIYFVPCFYKTHILRAVVSMVMGGDVAHTYGVLSGPSYQLRI